MIKFINKVIIIFLSNNIQIINFTWKYLWSYNDKQKIRKHSCAYLFFNNVHLKL